MSIHLVDFIVGFILSLWWNMLGLFTETVGIMGDFGLNKGLILEVAAN
jgi:hypothetical protein